MKCMQCQRLGRDVNAVATCAACGAGLCETHRRSVEAYTVAGMRFGCPCPR